MGRIGRSVLKNKAIAKERSGERSRKFSSERKNKAMRWAVAQDIATIIGQIPIIGDYIEDVIEDSAQVEIHKILTPREYEEFLKKARLTPLESIAMYLTLKKRR